jgi:succinate dehydrogenase / fumarate reductase cytochrome b subunit
MAQPMTLSSMAKTTVGTKAAMAVSGVLLFGFLIGHMAGNLQMFAADGGKAMNEYAHFLHSKPALLWGARIGLLAMVLVHVVSAMRLTARNRAARPVQYRMKKPLKSTYASRTMVMSGPIIMAYIIYHLMHFTVAGVGIADFNSVNKATGLIDVYRNVVTGFSNPAIAIAYIVANLLLGVHLWHGLWALFQSLGITNPRFDGAKRTAATALSALIIGGLVSIPVGVLAGIIHL